MKADVMQVGLAVSYGAGGSCTPAVSSPILVGISSFVVPVLWLLPRIEVDPEGQSLFGVLVGEEEPPSPAWVWSEWRKLSHLEHFR